MRQAIEATIYDEKNREIVADLYVLDMTHEEVAEIACLSLRGLYKRLGSIMPPMEDYLQAHA